MQLDLAICASDANAGPFVEFIARVKHRSGLAALSINTRNLKNTNCRPLIIQQFDKNICAMGPLVTRTSASQTWSLYDLIHIAMRQLGLASFSNL